MCLRFVKCEGTGNDFLIMRVWVEDAPAMARKLCDRHFGVGADGFMLMEEAPEGADYRMHYYNADGSRGEMCGNGLRCFVRYLATYVKEKPVYRIATDAGIYTVHLKRKTLAIDMGPAVLSEDAFLNRSLEAGGNAHTVHYTRYGVPHAVLFLDGEVADDEVLRVGPKLERHEAFSAGANVNFVAQPEAGRLIVKTFERGAGFTLSCGTGVCSSVLIARTLGRVGDEVKVSVPGGELSVSIDERQHLWLEGPARIICDGTVYDEGRA